ncbi:MAG: PTS IIA-like nitrogen regulatory protein PtsN [Gammaproteobacteria bacterium]|nr:PTS IIA-like nitrogen regulatory protein PtsN [Gammaproteobacteria bacterium]
MRISDILTSERIICNVNLSSKKAALEALSGLIAGASIRLDEQEVFNSLLTRERLGGTGLGNGIAIPHGRLKDGLSTIAAFIKLKQGVDYDAVDQQPVDLIFALLVPEHSTEEHLQVLAQLAEMFNQPEFLTQLRREESEEAIYGLLTG